MGHRGHIMHWNMTKDIELSLKSGALFGPTLNFEYKLIHYLHIIASFTIAEQFAPKWITCHLSMHDCLSCTSGINVENKIM